VEKVTTSHAVAEMNPFISVEPKHSLFLGEVCAIERYRVAKIAGCAVLLRNSNRARIASDLSSLRKRPARVEVDCVGRLDKI